MSDAKPQPEPSMEDIVAQINRIIAEDKKPGEAAARPAAEKKDDVLDLTEAVGEDGTVRRLTPRAPSPSERIEPAAARIEPEPPRVLPGTPAEAAAEPRLEAAGRDPAPPAAGKPVEPAAEPALAPMLREHVLSAAAAGAAAAALGRLAATPRPGKGPDESVAGEGGHTIEDIVREALRPLLRSWLDQNLPALAERLAREEIARVLHEAGLR